jgi:regulator of sigma E protease
MIFAIIVAFISLIFLLILHEFGHFVLAKIFGVRVEEFGIFFPPRLISKKIGETIYSLNLLPFGAFVRLSGETEKVEDFKSFSAQPVSKRALVTLGGVLSFWVMAAILFSIVAHLGVPTAISDEENANLIEPKVQVVTVAPHSPAQIAGIKPGDTIKEFKVEELKFKIQKIKELQELTEKYKGKEIILTIERGKETFDVGLIPRILPPAGEGAMGVALVRTAIKSYPWWISPWQGILTTVNLTGAIIQGYGQAIKNAIYGKPAGVELMGPVGVIHLFAQVSQLGVNYFLQFIGMVAIYLAIFNALPIPAVDGGKLLFLGIEAIRKKAIPQKLEQKINTIFLFLLIVIMILVTIKDIAKLF